MQEEQEQEQQKKYKIITFKNNGGRTGNLIFPYMLCKLLEIKYGQHKYVAYSPEFEKTEFMLLTEENINNIHPSDLLQKNIICDGYFQKSFYFINNRTDLLNVMREAMEDYWVLEDKQYFITDFFKETPRYFPTEKDIVVSLRLDDFIQYPCATSDILPPEYYLDILENTYFDTLYIICDKVKHDWEYKYLELFDKWNPIYVIGDSLYKDGALMRDCPRFIHSNSTFSWLMSFFSSNPDKKRYIPNTNMYKGQKLGAINIYDDILKDVNPMTHKEVFDLVEDKYLQKNIYPLSYSIPNEKIIKEDYDNKNKKNILSAELGGGGGDDRSTSCMYVYEYDAGQEMEYNQQYRDAFFALTKKKGGWDCLRHYEILANGCIPFFENIGECPLTTMISLPKNELVEIMKLRDFFVAEKGWTLEKENIYSIYHKKIMDHFRKNCTVSASVTYLLSKLQKPIDKINNILMLCCDLGVNYLRELSWIGIKRWIHEKNGIAVEYPKLSYLYEDFPEERKKELYGNGFTYTKCLPVDNTNTNAMMEYNNDAEIMKSIENKQWDIIIYGKTGPDEMQMGSIPFLPFWQKVSSIYNKNEIVFLYGGDECFDLNRSDKYTKHILEHAKYGTCFVRELVL